MFVAVEHTEFPLDQARLPKQNLYGAFLPWVEGTVILFHKGSANLEVYKGRGTLLDFFP